MNICGKEGTYLKEHILNLSPFLYLSLFALALRLPGLSNFKYVLKRQSMAIIELTTKINAPIDRCFLLSLSVDLHQLSTAKTNEKAIAGVTSGIMKLNDTVTWRANHFGIYQNLTTKIPEYDFPKRFVSEMVKGAFKKMHHQHLFDQQGNETIMKDIVVIEAPLGMLGKLFTNLILKEYMKGFLVIRNKTIKQAAEGDDWKKLLHEH
jgi:ligand-binding SRPBCC domain-containing protein